MKRIFNELKYAEILLKCGFISNSMGRDLFVLAKYFRYLGLKTKDVRNELINFCKKYDFDPELYYKKINWSVVNSRKKSLRLPVDIPITKNELEIIRNLCNYRYEKFLFTILSLAKYFNYTITSVDYEKNRQDYYLNESYRNILKYAHIARKKNESIHYYLITLGLIEQTYKSGRCYHILFSNSKDDSETAILITDIDNLISFYPPYCSKCKKPIVITNNRCKLCSDCQKEIRRNVDKIRKQKSIIKIHI